MKHIIEKPQNTNKRIPDTAKIFQRSIAGDVRIDKTTRILYSTDASIYQIEPIGVIFPRSLDDLSAIVNIADQYQVPVLARGSGSSLAGQAIGKAWIIDCSRYLNNLLEINPEEETALVEPGVILDDLNRQASYHGLRFGPDPASSERATLGGSIANNASGANSIVYGMAADHLVSAEVVLADGSLATFKSLELEEVFRKADIGNVHQFEGNNKEPSKDKYLLELNRAKTLEANIYRSALFIRQHFVAAIKDNWPRTWRRASGYNLNYLLPWSPSHPPHWFLGHKPYPPIQTGHINLAPILAGSEGTLAIFRSLTLRLVPKQKNSILCVLGYPSISAACDDVPRLLNHMPSAIELIPKNLIQLAMGVPAYAHRLTFLDELKTSIGHSSSASGSVPDAILVFELSGDDLDNLKERAQLLGNNGFIADSPESQNNIWNMRKAGLGILMSRTDDLKPLAFIEDLSVPVEHLGEFVREMERIFTSHNTTGDFYAHASAGCLHLRPLLDIKSSQGITLMRMIAEEAVKLTLRLGGAVSGEHGDGLARSEWLETAYGHELFDAFKLLKNTADPKGILNPGKIVDPQPMDANLRVQAISHDQDLMNRSYPTVFDFSSQGGFQNAVEQCNGAGVCRKFDGVMCPSYQVTQDEIHSTRGRANLLRALLYGILPDTPESDQILFDALSLCLACKGCKSECPSRVDMAKLKYEFLNQYYSRSGFSSRNRPLRDYLFAYIGFWSGLGYHFAPLINSVLKSWIFRWVARWGLGLSPYRTLPLMQPIPFRREALKYIYSNQLHETFSATKYQHMMCILMSDPFIEYFQPEVGMAALKALMSSGYQVRLLPVIGAGRTLISKGFLEAARKHAIRLVNEIKSIDPKGEMPVVGVEPSEVYTLRDEYLDLLPNNDYVKRLSKRTYLIEELLVRPVAGGVEGVLRIDNLELAKHTNNPSAKPRVLLHGHCYQKVQLPADDGYPNGVEATVKMLELAGYQVSVIDAGCCGMAGAFGYEAEHYHMSMKIGEAALFPAIRESIKKDDSVIIAAPGVSCQSQIKDGTCVEVVHPIMLI
jgi:FAD/FMN-containing dehydrogenase/Fe-S oxidoreductase